MSRSTLTYARPEPPGPRVARPGPARPGQWGARLRLLLVRWALVTAGIASDLILVLLHVLPPTVNLQLLLLSYVTYLGIEALVALAQLVADAQPMDTSSMAEELTASRLPAQLQRLTDSIDPEMMSETDIHSRLRPVLRDAARWRLAANHGVLLDEQPERSSRLLGPELWRLLRPDPPLPRANEGSLMRELRNLVEGVERI